MKYRVIKEIQDGWETSANVGDILIRKTWEGVPTLFKGKKAVCDADSPYAINHCEAVLEEVLANEEAKTRHNLSK